jgi:hypothetical protein
MGLYSTTWCNLSEPPKAKEIQRTVNTEVEHDWEYWRPIAYGTVTLTKEEYDDAAPLFVWKLNAAMDRRARLDYEAIEAEKAKQRT